MTNGLFFVEISAKWSQEKQSHNDREAASAQGLYLLTECAHWFENRLFCIIRVVCIADKSWEENTELLFFFHSNINVQQHFGRDFDERQLLFVSEIQTYTSDSMHAVKYKFAKKIIGNIILIHVNIDLNGWLKGLFC